LKIFKEKDGLDSKIAQGGNNLSIGEKQLVVIARSFLKRSKIVLMDEATSSIDIETEALV